MMKFKEWAEANVGIDLSLNCEAQTEIPADLQINKQFINAIQEQVHEICFDKAQRILHSHGHKMQEIYQLRHGKLVRVVDCVVFINSHAQAELLVKLASQYDVMLTVYGGGTNMTWALQCPQQEKIMIVSIDTSRLNHVRWVDRKNMTALIETGITGKDLEKELSRYGLVCGHESDSVEFSALGGWISNFALGTEFMYKLSRSKVWPASIRLIDNNQFQFGIALKTMPHSKREEFMDKVKNILLHNLLVVVFEGTNCNHTK